METDGHLAKLLADLPESLARDEVFVSELKNITTVVAVDKGDYLLRTGEICQDAYFINKGLFINLYVSEKGDECVTGFSSDYQYPFLSAIGYFTQAPSEFEIKALEAGELLRLSRTHIEDLSLRYPLFTSYYQNAMLTIISKLYSMFAIRQSCTAEEFIKYLYNHYMWIMQRVPDKYIAQYMGISNAWYCKLKKRIFN